MQGTMPGVHRQGIPCKAWMDNINTYFIDRTPRERVNQNDRGQR